MTIKWFSRSTVFAAFFAVTAFLLALRGLLTHPYVEVIIGLHVTVTGRAIAEDHYERRMSEKEKNQNGK